MLTYCKECGAELKDEAIFCSRCGSRVVEDEPVGPVPAPVPERAVGRARARTHQYPGLEKTTGRGWLFVVIAILALGLGGVSAALAILAVGSGGRGDVSPAAVVSTDTPAQSPLATSTVPGIPAGCRELASGCEAVVGNVGEVGLRLRDAPGASSQTKDTLRDGAEVCLTGEAVQADGVDWWPVRVNASGATLEGWSAATDPTSGEGPYLTATGESCD